MRVRPVETTPKSAWCSDPPPPSQDIRRTGFVRGDAHWAPCAVRDSRDVFNGKVDFKSRCVEAATSAFSTLLMCACRVAPCRVGDGIAGAGLRQNRIKYSAGPSVRAALVLKGRNSYAICQNRFPSTLSHRVARGTPTSPRHQ